MKKVLIVSINIHSKFLNYGAALHSFAFQRFLNGLGVDSAILDYKSKHFGDLRLDNMAVSAIKGKASIAAIILAILNTPSYRRKYKAFHSFYKQNCIMVDNNGKPYTYDDFNNTTLSFDYPIVVCESDVIWSPKTSNGFDRVFFCAYKCFEGKTKVAYAPSISNTLLSTEQEKEFKKLVANFDYLSAREWQTAEYVSKLINRECVHVLDPVMLLDEHDYEPYFEPQKYRNYLLVYNVMRNDRKMLAFAKKVAKGKGLSLIEISDNTINKFSHKTLTGKSIGEFLWLIKNAGFLITNGFHGACFAIVFKKEFLIFERDGIDLKVKSLLDTFGLQKCFMKHSLLASVDVNDVIIDWEDVYSRLEKQRMISTNFIKKVLNYNR